MLGSRFPGVMSYLSYTLVRTSRVCIRRHPAKHIRLHSHSVCYTPLKKIKRCFNGTITESPYSNCLLLTDRLALKHNTECFTDQST